MKIHWRVCEQIRERHRAGETIDALAEDYGLPPNVVRIVVLEPIIDYWYVSGLYS